MLPLMQHQKDDVDWIWRCGRGLLGNEPGLGKSRSAIEATKGMETLVIAPSMVLVGGTWKDEIAKWAEDPDKYTTVAYTSLNARVKTGGKDGKNLSATKPTGKVRPGLEGPWEAIIVDESHYMKGRETSWTAVIQRLAAKSDLVLSMTGTPVPNWSSELFTTLQLINPEEATPGKKYGSFWRWADEWFESSISPYGENVKVIDGMRGCTPKCKARAATDPCEHYQHFTSVNLGVNYRRVYRHHVLDLPEKTETKVFTPMEPYTRKLYNQLKTNFAASHEGTDLLVWNQGALNVMLDKCTVSSWFMAKNGKPRGGKLEQLRLDLSGRSRATLVLAHHRDVVEACSAVAESVGLRSAYVHGGTSTQHKALAIKAFKEGRLDVLCGSLDSVAEGMTLTVADMAIFVESSWKRYRNEQALYRIWRLGQEWPVTIRHYITPNSVDEKKRAIVALKEMDAIKTMTAAEYTALL